jgi:hypothetical protein
MLDGLAHDARYALRSLGKSDETMARAFWPGESAVGKRLKIGGPQSYFILDDSVSACRQRAAGRLPCIR